MSVVRKLVLDGLIPHKSADLPENATRPLFAVNFGARDGRGSGGNTDPTYPIFAELGFRGLAVEASPVFFRCDLCACRLKCIITSYRAMCCHIFAAFLLFVNLF